MIGHGVEHVGKGIGRHRMVHVYALEQVTGDSWSAHPHQKIINTPPHLIYFMLCNNF
jgi:hypothetical protein